MLEALIVFGVLWVLIWSFERDRRDELDAFTVGTAVLIPMILAVLIQILGGVLGFYPWSAYAAWVGALLATFIVLWKMLQIPVKRSAAYTGSVLAAQFAVGIMFTLAAD